MKHYLTIILITLNFSCAFAQTKVTHIDKFFRISSGTDFYVNGSFETYAVTPTGSGRIQNEGVLYLTDTLFDYGDNKIFGDVPGGAVHFIGSTVQIIIGGDTINFNKIELNNTGDTLILNQDISVHDTLEFITGNIFLNTNELMLELTGEIQNEINDQRIFGYPGEVTLERTFIGGQNYTNAGGIGMDMQVNAGTSVKVIRVQAIQYGVANESIEKFYTVIPATNEIMKVPSQLKYLDQHDLNNRTESELNIYTSESNGLVWRDKDGVADIVNDQIDYAGTDEISLNPLFNYTIVTAAEDSCDTPPYIAILEDTIALCAGNSEWIVADYLTGMELIWSDGQVNEDSIQVTTPGEYIITAIDNYGCFNSDTVTVINANLPTVSFTVDPSVCIGSPSVFTNNSSIPVGSVEYLWEFGDAFMAPDDTSSFTNPTYTYGNIGTYTVTLNAISNYGCSSSTTSNVIIKPYPVADFSTADACEDSSIIFVNNSSVFPVAGIVYAWDFDDGITTTTANPAHSYGSEGTYEVELVANASGCRDTVTEEVTVYPNPVADFSYVSACPGEDVHFTNASSVTSGFMNYSWDLGDGGNTSTLLNPSYPYPNSGNYNVSLLISTPFGCTNETLQTISVYDVPVAGFTFNNACVDNTVQFTNTSSIASGLMSYSWDLGNGNASVAVDPTEVYSVENNYTVELVVTSNNGCKDSVSKIVQVFPVPTASFVVNDDCEGDVFYFSNASTINFGNLNYEWTIPGIGTSNNQDESYTYNTGGTYNAELIVVSDEGCSDTTDSDFTVFANPVVTIYGGGATCGSSSQLWTLNSGSLYWSTTETNDTITAAFDGDYHLTVTSSEGCIGSDTVNVELNSNVTPSLGPDISVCDSIVLNPGYAGSTFLWSTNETTQSILVLNSGQYWVDINDQNNCSGRDTIVITVNQSTPISLGPDLVECDGNTITLDAGSGASGYIWNTGETTQTITVDSTYAYAVEFINPSLCSTYDTVLVTFNPVPTINLGPDGLSYCDSTTLDVFQTGASYQWDLGSSATTSEILVTQSGTYAVTVSIGNTGCFDQDTVTLTINDSPTLDLGNDSILCSYDNMTLDAGSGGTAYLWNTGSTNQTIPALASGTYYVDVIDINNCSSTDTITISYNAPFTIDLGDDLVLCSGADAWLFSGYSGGTYNWYDYTGTIGTTENINVLDTGQFFVAVTDSFGCVAEDSLTITPTSLSLTASWLAQSEVFEGEELSFINLSFPRPYDSYWNMGDGTIKLDSSHTHTYLDSGWYDVSLVVDNGVCTDSLTKQIRVNFVAKNYTPEDVNLELYNEIESINLYPNPNNGTFKLGLKLLEVGETNISIFDMLGRMIYRERYYLKEDILDFNMNNLRNGVYIMRVNVRNSMKTVKFVIAN